jgi:hypothetical protein
LLTLIVNANDGIIALDAFQENANATFDKDSKATAAPKRTERESA